MFIPAGIQAGTSLAAYFLRKRTPEFRNTAYGRRLMGVSRRGKYSGRAKRSLLGAAARTAGEVEQQQTAATRGRMAGMNLQGSIAGERLLAQPATRTKRALTDFSGRLEVASEQSKEQARDVFAQGTTQMEEQRRQEDNRAKMGLISGLTQAGGMGVQAHQLGKLEGMEGGKFAPLATAMASGMKVSPYAQRYFLKAPEFPDISKMSEEEAKQAVLEWFTRGGGF